ncbi:MAG: biotin transporter BioY [Acidimicrobiia bacterium]
MTYAPQVLATRVLPRSRVATVMAVVGFAVLTAVAAQWWIVLPFTPVPITGQTFAVLLSGAALGWRAGAASQMLYLGMGFVGLPVFTEGASGIDKLLGATGGYLIGFVMAAAVVGVLAERGLDRRLPASVLAFLAASLVIYSFGVAGLMVNLGMSFGQAVTLGVVPFVIGDGLKAVAAGVLTPATWRLLER